MADAFFAAGGPEMTDPSCQHTRNLLVQAVQAISDIELLAEAAARSMARGGASLGAPLSTGGSTGDGGHAGGAAEGLPRRFSAGNPLQTRLVCLLWVIIVGVHPPA